MDTSNSKFIGVINQAEGDIRMRMGDSINWRSAKKSDQIFSETYLFIGDNSRVSYGLIDESLVTVGANSMVYLSTVQSANVDARGLSLELIEGEMQVQLSPQPELKQVIADDTQIDLSKNQKLKVQLDPKIDNGIKIAVYDGDIKITRKNEVHTLTSGQVAELYKEAEPKINEIDPMDLEKLKREEEQRQKEALQDLKKKRQLGYLIYNFLSLFK